MKERKNLRQELSYSEAMCCEKEDIIQAKTERLLLQHFVAVGKLGISYRCIDHLTGEERIGKTLDLYQQDIAEAPEAQYLLLEFLGMDTSCLKK